MVQGITPLKSIKFFIVKIIKTNDTPTVIAGDKTLLKELLNPEKEETIRYSLAHAVVKVGQSSIPHQLSGSEVYYILSGDGLMIIDEETEKVETGDVVVISPNSIQHIKNIGNVDLVFLAICDPAWQDQVETI